ncbi:MAG: 6,7-dimethyl-8-ribityllumazine synthase [Actinobacteria bacterium]|nr:6,7-dimethyl-8-ribityllumazine synthase [Actinomycetota bacterium]
MPEPEGPVAGRGLKVGVAVAAFNAFVTEGLLQGALEALAAAGVEDPAVLRVAGSFELPVAAKALVASGCDAVVALGAVIKGETDHYEHVAAQTIAGLQQVALTTGVPVALGVLTARKAEQARARSLPGPGNKGAEAAEAAVQAAAAIRRLGGRAGGPDR